MNGPAVPRSGITAEVLDLAAARARKFCAGVHDGPVTATDRAVQRALTDVRALFREGFDEWPDRRREAVCDRLRDVAEMIARKRLSPEMADPFYLHVTAAALVQHVVSFGRRAGWGTW